MNTAQRNWLRKIGLLVLAIMLAPGDAGAVSPSPDEMLEAGRFVARMLEGVVPDTATRPGLEIVSNYDAVQKNTRFAKPLKLGGKPYSRGLFCHAASKIVVRLPGPGKTFEAQVGLDTNEQTVGGRGSVVFGVEVGGKEAFRSEVLREGMPPVPVNVELGGATEFVLQVGDSGDGISCDQADWAEARITLSDGQVVWLDELPAAVGPTLAEVGNPLVFIQLRGRTVGRIAQGLEGRTHVGEAGRSPHAVEHRLHRPEDRPRGAVCRD